MTSIFGGGGQPKPELPQTPAAPPPPPMFGQNPGKKPQAKSMQPSFLGTQQASNPTNTGQKTLLGS